MNLEHCSECNEPTGRSGRSDDSIFVQYHDKEVGPLCEECRLSHFVCEKCGEGVYPVNLTFQGEHEGCGGYCY